MRADQVPTEVEGRRVLLSSLDKVLWPRTGTTKREALLYYARIGPLMLAHVRRRPASFVRFPEGVDGQRFFTKHPPAGLPEWVPLVEVPSKSQGRKIHIAVDSLPVLVTMANLYALEVHVPQWTAETGAALHDRMIIDLDPGEGADRTDCCRVALRVRELLAEDGLGAWPKTSGGKGLHLLVPLVPAPERAVVDYARALAQRLERERPDEVVSVMTRARRHGRVFLDSSQNVSAKTTAAPYTLRASAEPGVSAPLRWTEVEAWRRAERLAFTPEQVVDRAERHGDLLAPVADPANAAELPIPQERR